MNVARLISIMWYEKSNSWSYHKFFFSTLSPYLKGLICIKMTSHLWNPNINNVAKGQEIIGTSVVRQTMMKENNSYPPSSQTTKMLSLFYYINHEIMGLTSLKRIYIKIRVLIYLNDIHNCELKCLNYLTWR